MQIANCFRQHCSSLNLYLEPFQSAIAYKQSANACLWAIKGRYHRVLDFVRVTAGLARTNGLNAASAGVPTPCPFLISFISRQPLNTFINAKFANEGNSVIDNWLIGAGRREFATVSFFGRGNIRERFSRSLGKLSLEIRLIKKSSLLLGLCYGEV